MSYSNVIKLTTDRLKLDLLPELGGRINKLVFNEFDIFHPLQIQDIKPIQSYKGGCFSLVPFSNRIKNSRFNFNQFEYILTKNDPPNAIHGHAYLGKWNVLKKTDSSAVIVYKHLANNFGWPWSYEVVQTITLEDNNIIFLLEILNKSNNPMPIGFGIHPYFNYSDNVKLKFCAQREWLGSPEEFPIKTKIIENNFNYKKGSDLWKEQKTICYENFYEEVEIFWLSNRKKVKIKTDKIFTHLIIHVPEHAKYFCVEPVSHPTDGFNLAYKNIENINCDVLMPNKKIKGLIKFEIDNF
jgi:aldose 1-epimerase